MNLTLRGNRKHLGNRVAKASEDVFGAVHSGVGCIHDSDSLVNEINAIYSTGDSNIRDQLPPSGALSPDRMEIARSVVFWGRPRSDMMTIMSLWMKWPSPSRADRFFAGVRKMDSKPSQERRREGQRRHDNAGPPQGMAERRINIERRLFNLCLDSGWGRGKTPVSGARTGDYAAG
ncbi:MAG TPA: hypothetical protein VK165_03400 [Azonexus sp.]|nr:hypothetical protein [Azonexus sp.]